MGKKNVDSDSVWKKVELEILLSMDEDAVALRNFLQRRFYAFCDECSKDVIAEDKRRADKNKTRIKQGKKPLKFKTLGKKKITKKTREFNDIINSFFHFYLTKKQTEDVSKDIKKIATDYLPYLFENHYSAHYIRNFIYLYNFICFKKKNNNYFNGFDISEKTVDICKDELKKLKKEWDDGDKISHKKFKDYPVIHTPYNYIKIKEYKETN